MTIPLPSLFPQGLTVSNSTQNAGSHKAPYVEHVLTEASLTVRECNFCECSEPFSLNVNKFGEEIVYDRRDGLQQLNRQTRDCAEAGGDSVDARPILRRGRPDLDKWRFLGRA